MKIRNKVFELIICLSLFAFTSCENPPSIDIPIDIPVEPTYYTVIFDSNGGTEISSQKIEKGKTATRPSTPNKNGYDFSDWYNGNSVFDFSTPIVSDIILIAKWTKISTDETIYTISFNLNDGSNNPIVKTQEIAANKNTSLKTVSELSFNKSGYIFTEWNTAQDGSGTKYSDGSEISINTNITLYAQWYEGNGTRYTVKHYQQNIADDNYTIVDLDTQILTGATNSSTAATSKAYDGFTAQPFNQKTIDADGNTVIEIYYNRNVITLIFSANGGIWPDKTTTDKTLTGKFGASVNIPEMPSLTDFKGNWDSEIQTIFIENKNYSVIWIENNKVQYKVTYMLQSLTGNSYEGNQKDTFYGISGEYTDARPKEIEGFVLSPSHTITQKIITDDGKTSVWIYYDRITVTLTFKANGEKWWDNTSNDIHLTGLYGAPIIYNKAQNRSTPWLLEKNGYETIYDKTPQSIFEHDDVYTASYKPILATYRVNHWKQNIENDEYTLFETEILSGIVGSKTAAEIKTYTGFAEPKINPNYLQTIAKDESTIINIYYNRNLITLTFSAEGGTWTDDTTTDKTVIGKFGATISADSIPIPTKYGYSFVSWDKSVSTNFESDTKYTAKWSQSAKVQYIVQHWKQNIDNDEYTFIQDDTQILYGFVGLITEAQSNQYEGFTVKNINQKIITKDESTIVDIYYNRNLITLTFVSFNSTINQTEKFGSKVSIPTVTRSHYFFTGWNKEIQTTYEHNETYTALWEGEKYIVTFKSNGGIGQDVSQEFTYGKTQKLLKNVFVNEPGYCFVGWSETQNSTKKDYSDEENYSVTGNTVLYAVWQAIDVTENNIAAVIGNPEVYVNGKTVIASPNLDNGKKVDYRINMTGTITEDTLEIIKTAIIQQKEKTLCLDMKMTSGITVLKQYSFMDSLSGRDASFALKVLYIPDCITTIETNAIMAENLEDVYLSNSLIEIKPGAFYKPGRLSFVYFMQIEGWYSFTDSAHTKNEKLIDVTKNDPYEFQNARCFKCLANYEPWGSLYLYYKGN